MALKIVFFGTPRFAATILEFLVQHGIQALAVVTQPDKAQGRSGKLLPPHAKLTAEKYQIPVYQPQKASDPSFSAFLATLKADLFVVAAYREILKENVLAVPPYGCINVHASILPKYRGAAPIQRCIMAGEKETGVTIMAMSRELDAGGVLSVDTTPIPDDMDAGQLTERLAEMGGPALLKVLERIERGGITPIPQNGTQASYAKKLTPEEGEIDWRRPSIEVYNQIRGVTPNPGAWCWVEVRKEKKRLLIKKAKHAPDVSAPPGTIVDSGSDALVVACAAGAINLLEIQLEGKKRMPSREFLLGVPRKDLHFLTVQSRDKYFY